ncbi:MAG: cobalamin biosynthesis protein [Candidatus Accumulibacter sp.]|jgi:cobalt-precorrin 5A hydrolase|nr:cobalamin biosynthesis protein [Accumulibacter sp.]
MRIAIIAITRHGLALGARASRVLPGAPVYAPEKLLNEMRRAAPEETPDGSEVLVLSYSVKTGELIERLFREYDGLIAVFSIGALVRMIAPCLKGKECDPAVVALDEGGRFAIPVLSGHAGGANALAGRLAAALGATPVLTTASDVIQTIGVDILGRELGWTLEACHDEVVRASAAVVNGEPVAFVQEAGSRDWWTGHANGRAGPKPANLVFFDRLEDIGETERFAALLWVSRREMPRDYAVRFSGRCVAYRPPLRVALGVGCDRGAMRVTADEAVDAALAACGARPSDVAAVASIDLKAEEPALLQMAEARGWTLRFYPAAELAAVDVPDPSEIVRRHTGTPSVSAAAALLSARGDKTRLLVEKCRRRGPDGRNVTVSVARIEE